MPSPKKYCTVNGCSRPCFGHGFCNAHYKRWRKTGDPGPAKIIGKRGNCTVPGCTRKHCAKGLCNAHLQRYNSSGIWPKTPIKELTKPYRLEKCLRPYCKDVGNHQGYCRKHNARRKAFISYGMSGWDDFDILWERCGGKCSICKIDLNIDSKNTHVDHCHLQIVPRGLLCESCNSLLGNAKESPEILMAAVAYLDIHTFR